MAKNKRVALTLPPEIDDAYTKLSLLTGQPKTAVITEILTDSMPIIIQVIKAIEEAKEGQLQTAVQTTAKFLQEASSMINQSHLDLGELKGKHGL